MYDFVSAVSTTPWSEAPWTRMAWEGAVSMTISWQGRSSEARVHGRQGKQERTQSAHTREGRQSAGRSGQQTSQHTNAGGAEVQGHSAWRQHTESEGE